LRTPTYSCIEAFCGAGGLSLGLERAGFNVRTAFDINEQAVRTFNSYRRRELAFVGDARLLSARELRQKAVLSDGEILDLLAGGPPCQGFSKQKRGAHLGDGRNDLILEYARLIRELSPRFFLLENVAMFGQKRGKAFIIKMEGLLNDYELTPHFYNCADYGLAQTRERFVIVGRRKDIMTRFRIPKPTVPHRVTVGDAIGDLPEPPEDFTDHPVYPNHQRARVTVENIQRFSFVPPGGGWQDIPEEFRLPCHRKVDTKRGGWPDVYGRLEWDGYATTITGGFDSFSRGRYGHPSQDRPLTPREAARLQGFPDNYVFFGTRHDIRHQIGNAVPPPLAEAVGLEILRSLMIADDCFVEEEESMTQVGYPLWNSSVVAT
jgi:DNA (cytosine-5)-methyltransferase 1